MKFGNCKISLGLVVVTGTVQRDEIPADSFPCETISYRNTFMFTANFFASGDSFIVIKSISEATKGVVNMVFDDRDKYKWVQKVMACLEESGKHGVIAEICKVRMGL